MSGREIVEVIWEDAVLHAGWHSPDALPETATVSTVGYLVAKDLFTVKVAQGVGVGSDDDDDVGGIWAIPMGMVREIRSLRRG